MEKLLKLSNIDNVVVSSYQSVSGAGKDAMLDLKNKTSKQTSNNSHVQSEMHQAIENGAYHRVDIANLIRQQKSKSIFHKLFNWQKD